MYTCDTCEGGRDGKGEQGGGRWVGRREEGEGGREREGKGGRERRKGKGEGEEEGEGGGRGGIWRKGFDPMRR